MFYFDKNEGPQEGVLTLTHSSLTFVNCKVVKGYQMLIRIKLATTFIDLGLGEKMIFYTFIKYLLCNSYRITVTL